MSVQSRKPIAAPTFETPVFRPSLLRRLAIAWTVWRDRIEMRRALANMDARSLRDAGISPAAAAYESGKPFWRPVGGLR
ncbi:MAG TPA: DUF1127 domain-containing protein [Reyranellaceae bacterium]|nr:DUF1127 domain-containing protein [Reyranellaceae bacterium]